MKSVKIQLIDGRFNTEETIDLLEKLIKIKINFHSNKIKSSDIEEDIKYRENRIKVLQDEMYNIRKMILNSKQINLKSMIDINSI
ncbi:MAG: hypothetical protein IT245_02330 [Bacteroidia bacterium]|nr:hypothetical protein [Bacteroidia bacterium]